MIPCLQDVVPLSQKQGVTPTQCDGVSFESKAIGTTNLPPKGVVGAHKVAGLFFIEFSNDFPVI